MGEVASQGMSAAFHVADCARDCTINQNGKRKVVVAIRERGGRALTLVFKSELASTTFFRTRVARGTELMAYESNAWNGFQESFSMKRINHQEAYCEGRACTNGTEEFFNRMRRTEIGRHHHIAAVYLPRYASESAWRNNHRRISNGEQFRSIVSLFAKKQAKRGFLRVLAAVEGGVGNHIGMTTFARYPGANATSNGDGAVLARGV
jgi:ISXO2-like transposase domain